MNLTFKQRKMSFFTLLNEDIYAQLPLAKGYLTYVISATNLWSAFVFFAKRDVYNDKIKCWQICTGNPW